jgi:hypothetical protein
MKFKSFILILILITLTACSTPAKIQPSGPIVTLPPTWTSPPTETSADTPQPPTLPPTQITETPEPTEIYIPYPDSPPLSELTLTREEILDAAREETTIYIEQDTIYLFDRTPNLNDSCLIECTKQEIKIPPVVMMITMIRAQDESSAIQKANELSADVDPYPFQEEYDMHSTINAPTNNSHIGFSTWNSNIVVVTSVGPIALRVENFGPFSSDGLWEVAIVITFANLQIDKLKTANVIP